MNELTVLSLSASVQPDLAITNTSEAYVKFSVTVRED